MKLYAVFHKNGKLASKELIDSEKFKSLSKDKIVREVIFGDVINVESSTNSIIKEIHNIIENKNLAFEIKEISSVWQAWIKVDVVPPKLLNYLDDNRCENSIYLTWNKFGWTINWCRYDGNNTYCKAGDVDEDLDNLVKLLN